MASRSKGKKPTPKKRDTIEIIKTEITLNLKGKTVGLTIGEARQLRYELDRFLGHTYPWTTSSSSVSLPLFDSSSIVSTNCATDTSISITNLDNSLKEVTIE